MDCSTFCTCKVLDCPKHPKNHNDGCTPCIIKNLEQHEIPACFWDKIGDDKQAKSDYTFYKFAQAVMATEKGS